MLSANPVCCSALRVSLFERCMVPSLQKAYYCLWSHCRLSSCALMSVADPSKCCRGRWFIIADSFGVGSNVGHIVQGRYVDSKWCWQVTGLCLKAKYQQHWMSFEISVNSTVKSIRMSPTESIGFLNDVGRKQADNKRVGCLLSPKRSWFGENPINIRWHLDEQCILCQTVLWYLPDFFWSPNTDSSYLERSLTTNYADDFWGQKT